MRRTILTILAFYSFVARGTPEVLDVLCSGPDSARLCSKPTKCEICHVGSTTSLNSFGSDLIKKMQENATYQKSQVKFFILEALKNVANVDSDKDGVGNSAEIIAGSLPGNAESLPDEKEEKIVYSEELAFRKVKILYCGQRPSYAENESLRRTLDKKKFVHDQLQACLESDWWRSQGLPRLADNKIRPIAALGLRGTIVLADYNWDYRLFSYVLSGDRDFRDLLRADYHINEQGEKIVGPVGFQLTPRISQLGGVGPSIVIGTGQPLDPDRRLGMITTQWFLMMNTMFSAIPRTTAAQAFRAYLGLDLAKYEGISPIANEPRDVDSKGVGAAECASCHSTLDPLAYSLANYRGIETDILSVLLNQSGTYSSTRSVVEKDGAIFGRGVSGPKEWADEAVKSNAFATNIATMFYKQAIGRKPESSSEISEFNLICKQIPDDRYQAEKLIHRLVDTMAFGGVVE